MTRAAKIQKLGNAIRRYRGIGQERQPEAIGDALRWCAALKLPEAEAIVEISNFVNIGELQAWLNSI